MSVLVELPEQQNFVATRGLIWSCCLVSPAFALSCVKCTLSLPLYLGQIIVHVNRVIVVPPLRVRGSIFENFRPPMAVELLPGQI